MQSLKWYYTRLRKMTIGEIGWRITGIASREKDRITYLLTGQIEPKVDELESLQLFQTSVSVVKPEQLNSVFNVPELVKKQEHIVNRANKHVDFNLDLFNLKEVCLGSPPVWDRDFCNNITTEHRLSFDIDYRDVKRNGDCKFVWEPNRHHQLVVLALAYRFTREDCYLDSLKETILSWIESNKFGFGMNWRSPLELGLRLINWVWALDLVKHDICLSKPQEALVLKAVYLHLIEITKHYSFGSSANNHLVGEAAGVYVGTSYFVNLPNADSMRQTAKAILEKEILNQSFEDGCTREHALGYQFFVMQFFLYSGWIGKLNRDYFSQAYWDRLDKMISFAEKISAAGPPPMFGDKDDGYVLDLGDGTYEIAAYRELFDTVVRDKPRANSSLAATLYPSSGHGPEPVMSNEQPRVGYWFKQSGYILLQACDEVNTISAFIDAAELGYGSIAAHGHADALSVTLRVNHHELLIDPGTYDYFSYPDWRTYFRGTSAHNTVEIDGLDQSVMAGPFMWETHAHATVEDCTLNTDGGYVKASHDGYTRLEDKLIHQREIRLSMKSQSLEIIDSIQCLSHHHVRLFFHFSEHCEIRLKGNTLGAMLPDFKSEIDFDERLALETCKGTGDAPGPGWRSQSYHELTEITTVIASVEIDEDVQLITRIRW